MSEAIGPAGTTPSDIAVAAFDAQPDAAAAALLRPCCSSLRWIELVVGGRPYRSLDAVLDASQAAVAQLDWSDIEQAMSAHPRIGERSAGTDREAAFSRQEQAAGAAGDTGSTELLRAGNEAYEQRFGYVFLICATGKSAAEILDALRGRLVNDPLAEREVVRAQLCAIVRLRLIKIFS